MTGHADGLQRIARRPYISEELKLRVLSAAVLGVLALLLGYLGVWPFAVLVAIIGVLMSWEWGRLVRGPQEGNLDTAFFVHAGFVVLAIALAALGQAAIGLLTTLIGMLVVGLFRRQERSFLSSLGVAYVSLPAIALLWLRDDPAHGFVAALFVLVLVWTSDSFALITGRGIGGPRLWPALSPTKTWAGLIGATLASGACGYIFGLALNGAMPWRLALLGLLLGAMAQGGDLLESALKRHFDVKDTSGLIPGHGGVLDRMDGLVVAAVAAALVAAMTDAAQPARALLMGA